jgi:hypothetical protein
MTQTELNSIRCALELLHRLVPEDEPRGTNPRMRNPVLLFARHYLMRQPGTQISTAELWQFYREIVEGGELEPLTKQVFERALRGAMEMTYGVKKSHNVKCGDGMVRGFRNIAIREVALPLPTPEVGAG